MRRRPPRREPPTLRRASERLRRRLGLLSGDDLERWLEQHGAGLGDWERWLRRAHAGRPAERLGTARLSRADVRAARGRRRAARRTTRGAGTAAAGPPRAACGAIALAVVGRHHGVATPPRTGPTLGDLVGEARRAGLDARAAKLSPRGLLALPLPALCHLRDGHWTVVRALAEDRVLLEDPATGAGTASRAAFEAAWSGWTVLVRGRRDPCAPWRRA